MEYSSSKTKKSTLYTQSDSITEKLFIWQLQRTTLGILLYFLSIIICTKIFTRTYNCYEVAYSFLFEIENDGMEPSKHYFFYITRNTRISSHEAPLWKSLYSQSEWRTAVSTCEDNLKAFAGQPESCIAYIQIGFQIWRLFIGASFKFSCEGGGKL